MSTYVFEITTLRHKGREVIRCTEYVTANDIKQVWESLAIEREDLNTEIIGIKRMASIIRQLQEEKSEE